VSNERGRLPLYARMLRLRYLRPGGALCFLFFEGAAILGVLLSLAELTPWWSVAVLPATIAAMVKVNDVVAGALGHSASGEPEAAPVRDSGPVRADVPRPAVPGALGSVVARASVPGRTPAAPPPGDSHRKRELPRP
jgi:hypothetical protein